METILNHRKRGRGYQYFVKWWGYPITDASWEPEHVFSDDSDSLTCYKIWHNLWHVLPCATHTMPSFDSFDQQFNMNWEIIECLEITYEILNNLQDIRIGLESSVRGSGCMDRKKTENWTEPDWLGPDQWLQLPAFQNKKTTKKPVATDFRYSSKIRTFWAYFEKNRARNAHATAKMICYRRNPTLYDIS